MPNPPESSWMGDHFPQATFPETCDLIGCDEVATVEFTCMTRGVRACPEHVEKAKALTAGDVVFYGTVNPQHTSVREDS